MSKKGKNSDLADNGIKLPSEDWKKLEALAKKKGITPSALVEEIIAGFSYLPKELKKLNRQLARLRKKHPDIFAKEAEIKGRIEVLKNRLREIVASTQEKKNAEFLSKAHIAVEIIEQLNKFLKDGLKLIISSEFVAHK